MTTPREILAEVFTHGIDRDPYDLADRVIKELDAAGFDIVLFGKADWLFEDELGMHIPACSRPLGDQRCHVAPLRDPEIRLGDCGRLHVPPDDSVFA